MRSEFSASADINAPAEQVWALVNDFDEWPRWIRGIKRIEQLSPGPLGKGSRLCVTARFIITVKLYMTLTEFLAPQRAVMEGRVLGTRMTRYYVLEPAGKATRLTVGGELEGPLAFLVRRGGQALSRQIVQGAKWKIEGSTSLNAG